MGLIDQIAKQQAIIDGLRAAAKKPAAAPAPPPTGPVTDGLLPHRLENQEAWWRPKWRPSGKWSVAAAVVGGCLSRIAPLGIACAAVAVGCELLRGRMYCSRLIMGSDEPQQPGRAMCVGLVEPARLGRIREMRVETAEGLGALGYFVPLYQTSVQLRVDCEMAAELTHARVMSVPELALERARNMALMGHERLEADRGLALGGNDPAFGALVYAAFVARTRAEVVRRVSGDNRVMVDAYDESPIASLNRSAPPEGPSSAATALIRCLWPSDGRGRISWPGVLCAVYAVLASLALGWVSGRLRRLVLGLILARVRTLLQACNTALEVPARRLISQLWAVLRLMWLRCCAYTSSPSMVRARRSLRSTLSGGPPRAIPWRA